MEYMEHGVTTYTGCCCASLFLMGRLGAIFHGNMREGHPGSLSGVSRQLIALSVCHHIVVFLLVSHDFELNGPTQLKLTIT